MHCAQQHLWMHLHSPQKMHMHSYMRAYATAQKLLCHEIYCELILSLAQASCRLSFAARPPAGSTKSVAWRCSLKKSVQIHASSRHGRHCGVAQASSDHPRLCRSHPVCLSVALALGHGVSPSQKIIFAIFRASRGGGDVPPPSILWVLVTWWGGWGLPTKSNLNRWNRNTAYLTCTDILKSSKQSSKQNFAGFFCHVSLKRDLRALDSSASSFWKCHCRWDRL